MASELSGHSEAYELEDNDSASYDVRREQASGGFGLPPADGGREAWLCLIACFNVEALVWGFPFSFGLFEQYYSHHPSFARDASRIATIGTTSLGIMYFSSPMISAVYQQWPNIRRISCWVGLAVLVISLIGASFTDNVDGLLATQGVLYAVGGGILYYPAIVFLDEWFIKKKGVAMGIMWAGTGVSGVVIPFVLNWLLASYGYQTALRVWAVTVTCFLVPTLFFMKPRLPVTAASRARPTDVTFLRSQSFWFLQVGSLIQNLGFFIPSIYIPLYAQSIGLTRLNGTTAISFFNAATVFGTIALGALVDRWHVTTVILISSLGAGVAVLLFWGFSTSLPMLYVFAILYGLFGGGFSGTWSGYASSIRQSMRQRGQQEAAMNVETGMVLAFIAAGKGIGAVVSGPLSSQLLKSDSWKGHAGWGYGTGYGSMILFTGVCACIGCLPWVGRQLDLF